MSAAPAIITTPPTFMDSEHDHKHDYTTSKKRGRLQHFTLRRRSFDPASVSHPGGILRKSMDKKRSAPLGSKKGPRSCPRPATLRKARLPWRRPPTAHPSRRAQMAARADTSRSRPTRARRTHSALGPHALALDAGSSASRCSLCP
jgi:hypothetical protein